MTMMIRKYLVIRIMRMNNPKTMMKQHILFNLSEVLYTIAGLPVIENAMTLMRSTWIHLKLKERESYQGVKSSHKEIVL